MVALLPLLFVIVTPRACLMMVWEKSQELDRKKPMFGKMNVVPVVDLRNTPSEVGSCRRY
jgi:hypothetical protein